MPPSNPANHTSRPWQQTVLLACDSKNSVLTEMAGCINPVAYSPYGQQSAQLKRMAHLGFNGEMCEARTDWYFLGNGYRVYDPRLMRFHSPDKFSPFGKGGMHAYVYCGGEPVMRVDPTGESWLFNRFADIWGLLSPVGTGANADRTTEVPVNAKSGGVVAIFFGALDNSKKPFQNPSTTALGKSRPRNRSPVGLTPSPTTSIAAQPGASINSTRTKFVLEGNYGKRPQNEYSKVKTRGGLRISGTDSGTRQFPSSSRDISSSASVIRDK